MQKKSSFARKIFPCSISGLCTGNFYKKRYAKRDLVVFTFTFILLILVKQAGSQALYAENVKQGQKDFRESKYLMEISQQPLMQAIEKVSRSTGYRFAYPADEVSHYQKIAIQKGTYSIDELLRLLLEHTTLNYKKEADKIILYATPKRSQQVSLKGMVVDEAGLPLPGASIQIKETNKITTTNAEGIFQIQVAEVACTLLVRMMGYEGKELVVSNLNNPIRIQLVPSNNSLDEVVVVGYGTQRRKDISGAIASLNNKDIEDVPVYSMENAMQGQAAGVNISSSSATPGGGINVNIRGVTSFTASSQPLYVIDGIPIVSSNSSQLSQTLIPTNPMADINPNDIESIEILKDASSAAIYGSRGANGVILITTKRGKEGRTEVGLDYYTGFQKLTHEIPMMNSKQFIEFMNVAAVNDGRGENYWSTPGTNHFIGDPTDPNLPNYNIYDYIFRTAPISNYELSLRGGNAKTKFFANANFFDQQGIQIGQGFKRLTSRINLDHQINDKLSVGTNVMLSRSLHDRTETDAALYGVVVSGQAWDPTQPLFNEDGSYASSIGSWSYKAQDNPVLLAKEYDYNTQSSRALASMFVNYEVIPGLLLKESASLDYNNTIDERYVPSIARAQILAGTKGTGSYGTSQNITWLNEGTLSFDRKFNEDTHHVNLVAGYTVQRYNGQFSLATGQNYPTDKLKQLSLAASIVSSEASRTAYSLLSFFGRLNYGYKERYLATFTLRRDGSSRFGNNKQFGMFPSASLAWRVSNEPFLARGTDSFLSDFKVRASYGVTGNQEGIDNYAWRGLWSLNNPYDGNAGSRPDRLENPDLGWEKTAQADIGLDMAFFKNRLSITADYFNKQTTDLLMQADVPGSLGFANVYSNIGEIHNKGFEFSFNSTNMDREFKWTSSFNISFVRNKVIKVISDGQILSREFILKEGMPLSTFNLVKFMGVNPDNGDAMFEDINHDGIIDFDDRQIVGHAQPNFTGGFTNNFSYKNFDLSVFFHFVEGNKIFNQGRYGYENSGYLEGSIPYGNFNARSLNYWKQPGDVTDIPRPSHQAGQFFRFSSQYLEDGSFLRLKNIRLSYRVPASVLKKTRVIKSLRVYAAAVNLFTWTDYTGFDPEVNSNTRSTQSLNSAQGVDFGSNGQARTFTFGINMGL